MIANNFGRSVSTELKLFKTMDSCSMANWSRQDSSSKFRYEGKFSSAWFDISKSKTTPGSSYMYRYDRCRSLISCLSAFLRLFLVRQLGERVFKQFLIQFAINTKRTISDTNNRRWYLFALPLVFNFVLYMSAAFRFVFRFGFRFVCQLSAFSNAETK